MGLYPGWPNWYVCVVPGFYELSGSVAWAATGAGLAGYTGQAWFAIAQRAAQALASGTGTPLTVGQYVCPVGEATRFNAASMNPVCAVTTRMYLGLGDMVALCAEQNFTAARSTSITPVNSMMSIRFEGLATVDDRTQFNTSIANGGIVTLKTSTTPGTFTYTNLHTYPYQGEDGFSPYSARAADVYCYQGLNGPGDRQGSQTSQIVFNTALMISQLSGLTLTSATLTATNQEAWYNTGSVMMLGKTTVGTGHPTYDPQTPNSTPDVIRQKFKKGQQLTFAIPVTLVQEFVSNGATAFILGDSETTDLDYFGRWAGGPGSWILTVNHK
jgi:hypothetical protein